MSTKRTRAWTVSGDVAAVEQAVTEFAAAEGFDVEKLGTEAWTLERGSEAATRLLGKALEPQKLLPLKGSIVISTGDATEIRVEAGFEQDGGNGFPLNGLVEGRYEKVTDALFDELGGVIGAPHAESSPPGA